jgi:hypothetical protein
MERLAGARGGFQADFSYAGVPFKSGASSRFYRISPSRLTVL